MGKKIDSSKIETAAVPAAKAPAKKATAKKPSAKVAAPAAPVAPVAKAPAAKAPAVKAKKAKVEKTAYTQDDIALRAYFIAEKRHREGIHGDSHSDWIEAERQLLAESKKKPAAKSAK